MMINDHRGIKMKSVFTYFLFLLIISIFFPISCLSNELSVTVSANQTVISDNRRGIGSDTISTGQSLYPNETIYSRHGRFELGFFSPGYSSNVYVGIWYRNISARTVVWVANRDNPIRSSYYDVSRLEMSNGSLNIYVNSEIIRTIGEVNSNATEAVVLDTGNLVLTSASSMIIWHSFDNPMDTWLPGGCLGFLPGTESELVSWRNPDDPSSGNFSLGMQANRDSELLITAKNEGILWRSGIWQDRTFASLSDISNFFNFTYVTNGNAEYFTYNVSDESVISRIQIDYIGRMVLYVWVDSVQAWDVLRVQPSDACKRYAICGPNSICDINNSPICSCLDGFQPRDRAGWNLFDFSRGCGRTRPLECAEERTGYVEVNNIRLPANPEALEIRRNGVCEIVCSLNCSCGGYAYDDVGGCLLFMGDLVDLERLSNESTGGNLYVRIESEVALAIARPANENPEAHQNMLLLDLNLVGNSNGEKKNNQYELPIFSFSSIAESTNNFSIANKLGEGGFGPVYKGELLNGQFVAVKRLSRRSGQGLEEFKNETELIAKLQHRNLVGIIGCCIENDEKILVYEFMPNKSLDFFLFEPANKELLNWRRRVHIIEGIAQGLLYLHHYSRLRIVHRDLKASNILLDAEMNPKISDFGMARIFGGNDSQANTKRIVGTYGYMSPEYAMEGLFSVKSDVFAFGVLLLEIISGKKNTGFYGSDYLSLLGYAWHLWKHDRVLELIDPIMEMPSSSSSTPMRYIQIGLLCVQESPDKRPLMSDIVAMLNNEQTLIASPQHPAFIVGRTLSRASPGQGKVEICSENGLTVSQMAAR